VSGAYLEVDLPASDVTAYAAANPLNSDPTIALNQIISQKWALNLNNSFEGRSEQRRTGMMAILMTIFIWLLSEP